MSDEAIPISIYDPRYPPLLRQIHEPPQTLYVRGNVDILQTPHLLAVVGSRKNTYYGRQAIEKILTPVVQADVILVSGFAHGIDALAHSLSLLHQKPTIAILGSGTNDNVVYPAANQYLIKKILAGGGTLVSEYPPITKARTHHFPERNRIIAGLCQVSLVVQAAKKSGSLITARLAMESNRDVAAVPGTITDPLSAGTNQLLRDGAHMILEAADIFTLYGLDTSPSPNLSAQLTLEQSRVLKHLTADPQHIDAIIEQTKLPAAQTSSLLLELELTGAVENIGGMQYVRK